MSISPSPVFLSVGVQCNDLEATLSGPYQKQATLRLPDQDQAYPV